MSESNAISWTDIADNPDARKVLDHGFIYLKSVYGDDSTVCEAARISYGKGTKSVADDRNLIRYLVRHRHTSPLEQCEATFVIKFPLFVLSQWVRHRTANLNVLSGRYSIMPDEYYTPDVVMTQSQTNKQGSGNPVDSLTSNIWKDTYKKAVEVSKTQYDYAIASDIAREQARIVIPQSQYTLCVWKCDIHNIMHFLKLRLDTHAQYEIRVYAQAMYELLKGKFPLLFEAFDDYILNAMTLSAKEIEALSLLVGGGHSADAMEKAKALIPNIREFNEFIIKYNRILKSNENRG